MGERQMIEERIRRKQAEVASLQEKLKAAKVYLGALRDVLKLLNTDQESDADAPESKLKAGSSVALARDVIMSEGEAVHVDDLLRHMGRPVSTSNRSSLVGSLAAYVRKNEIFTRVAPNTFGLIELGHSSDEEFDKELDEEPPVGFGRAPVAVVEWGSDLDDDIPF